MSLCNPSDLDRVEQFAAEGYGELEDYYPRTAAGELTPTDPAVGRNVGWDAVDGRSIRVDPEYLTAIAGNIFEPDKLAAIISGIEQSPERLVFTAPYGTVSVVGLIDVTESIEYAEDEGLERPLTTGDGELDQWLVEPEDLLSDTIGEEWDYDSDAEYAAERLRFTQEMEQALAEAVVIGQGDLGKLTFTIRDGNHRAFGAILAGEPFVWMILEENQFQDLDPGDPQDRLILDELE